MLFSIHDINNGINSIIRDINDTINDTQQLCYKPRGSLVIVQMKSFEFFGLEKVSQFLALCF